MTKLVITVAHNQTDEGYMILDADIRYAATVVKKTEGGLPVSREKFVAPSRVKAVKLALDAFPEATFPGNKNADAWFTRAGVVHTAAVRDIDLAKGVATGFEKTVCKRCGGAGGSDAWKHTGYTCYDCGGSGGHGRRPVKVYSLEKLDKLDTAKMKRDATLAEKARIAEEKRQAEADAKRAEWLKGEPEFAKALKAYKAASFSIEFLSDMVAKFDRTSDLTRKQIDAFVKTVNSRIEDERKDAEAEDVVEGKIDITGEILSVKQHVDDYYYPPKVTRKMIVRDDRGFKVWGSVPSSIYSADRGDRVSFSARVTRSDDDAKFGFFKRPTKAKIIADPV